MQLSKNEYDQVIEIATNKKNSLYIVKFGNGDHCWRYWLKYENQQGFETGEKYTTKQDIIKASREMILSSLCGCFDSSHIKEVVSNNCYVNISQNEKIAINSAIHILNNSNSDHADQALCYLTKLVKRL